MQPTKNPTALIILDGFGYSSLPDNAIACAYKPHLTKWFQEYPYAFLHASGSHVGLLPGLMGNSEVGHMTIGAGKIIPQPVKIIDDAIKNKSFFNNSILKNNLEELHKSGNNLHLMGLLSNAGVHAYQDHLHTFIKVAVDHKINQIYLHPFLDGRDSDPQQAYQFLTKLSDFIKNFPTVIIGSISGRFYGMDRDQNWDRTEQSYRMLTEEQSVKFTTWQKALGHYYTQGIIDEFIPPTQLNTQSIIQNGDGIIFFNTRPDRARQLTQAFVDPTFNKFVTKKLKFTFFITPVPYFNPFDSAQGLASSLRTASADKQGPSTSLRMNGEVTFSVHPERPEGVEALFIPPQPKTTLMDALAQQGLTTFSIAETEKYAHVTYFFRGGREQPLSTEKQVLIPSIKTKTYADFPCMSAKEITQTVIHSLERDPKDFYLINYANADMVGHSGNYAATVKAIECLDEQLGILYNEIIEQRNGTIYITADHGNAEAVIKDRIHTQHTTNKVPFLMLRKDLQGKQQELPLNELADIRWFIEKNCYD